ncbi:aminotransferase class III-fold pyridoxal phosphate-dependent enzyme [Endozoicomonas arenosclerae]|uniref:aminotransferase class III-fold pyridoxal phosphate-dependent enzyme n=1 Tax=Endozoicomonas arenosclerae TaxID=1633495 RepID=UPI000A5A1D50|nr:aminotransferase class III-fold pyridoxal phosphate-dependent enzyme [Endozoicomonas arenosclerae]
MEAVKKHLHAEGDINTTAERTRWQEQLDHPETSAMLEEDARYFLHQSMSTPCLDVLEKADGIYIEDARGLRYMDFHGNNVHQLGYGHPHVVQSIKHKASAGYIAIFTQTIYQPDRH